MIRLRVEEDSESRDIFVEEEMLIGRSESAGIRVSEPRASREHAKVRTVSDGLLVTDLGSTNGTWQDDVRISRALLRDGATFRIGGTRFTVLVEAQAPRRRRRLFASALIGALLPVLVLAILSIAGVKAVSAHRDTVLEGARGRLALASYRLASAVPDLPSRVTALKEYRRDFPDSRWAPDAEKDIDAIEPRLARAATAKKEMAALTRLGKGDSLPFDELRYRYEKLLDRYQDLPGVTLEAETELKALYRAHEAALGKVVDDVRDKARDLGANGEYGRAMALLTSFVDRNPVAAEVRGVELRKVEAAVMEKALAAYRELLSHADSLAKKGEREKAAALLRKSAPPFNGTRFLAFLRLRADSLAGRGASSKSSTGRQDLVALRRSYYLLAQRAEEQAGAGLFAKAARRYAEIIKTIRIPSIRKEFTARKTELENLSGLVSRLKEDLATETKKFRPVMFAGRPFRVREFADGVLTLESRGQSVGRPWASLKPDDLLALFRAAPLSSSDRLLFAAWCFEMNLRGAFSKEILADLSDKDLAEAAGHLYARKEGVPYPKGGFVAYGGRILTRTQYAEEIHREQVEKLRSRQLTLLRRLGDQPVFARKLAKLQTLRAALDKARKYALSLIFDTVKYFYPYRNRMAEYTPVQMEVNARVKAVRKIWDNPYQVTLKESGTVRQILKEIGAVDAQLKALGVDSSDFERKLIWLTSYLGKTFTVRNFYIDEADRELIEYSHEVLAFDKTVKSVATDAERKQVEITNGYRMMMGRRALVIDDRLVKAARGHSAEMSREGYFSHFSPHADHRTPQQRMALAGYHGSPEGENIAMGRDSPQAAHDAWLQSSGHHRNILEPFYTEMGSGKSGKYWTQDFGRTHLHTFPDDGGKK